MIHGRAMWKPGIGEIAKGFRDIAPGPYKGGLNTPYEPCIYIYIQYIYIYNIYIIYIYIISHQPFLK